MHQDQALVKGAVRIDDGDLATFPLVHDADDLQRHWQWRGILGVLHGEGYEALDRVRRWRQAGTEGQALVIHRMVWHLEHVRARVGQAAGRRHPGRVGAQGCQLRLFGSGHHIEEHIVLAKRGRYEEPAEAQLAFDGVVDHARFERRTQLREEHETLSALPFDVVGQIRQGYGPRPPVVDEGNAVLVVKLVGLLVHDAYARLAVNGGQAELGLDQGVAHLHPGHVLRPPYRVLKVDGCAGRRCVRHARGAIQPGDVFAGRVRLARRPRETVLHDVVELHRKGHGAAVVLGGWVVQGVVLIEDVGVVVV